MQLRRVILPSPENRAQQAAGQRADDGAHHGHDGADSAAQGRAQRGAAHISQGRTNAGCDAAVLALRQADCPAQQTVAQRAQAARQASAPQHAGEGGGGHGARHAGDGVDRGTGSGKGVRRREKCREHPGHAGIDAVGDAAEHAAGAAQPAHKLIAGVALRRLRSQLDDGPGIVHARARSGRPARRGGAVERPGRAVDHGEHHRLDQRLIGHVLEELHEQLPHVVK